MSKRLIITVGTLIVIAIGAGVAMFLAKGYTFSPKSGTVSGTGIISVSSVPDGASVYVDGHLATATNSTVSQLPPKKYTIKILKDGFIPWEKQIEVRAGLVSEVKATLFPAIPTIYPLTFNGVANPVLSPDGQHLAFAVPLSDDSRSMQKGGIWVWTMGSQPISFAKTVEPHQIVASTSGLDFSTATLRWSPDGKELLATLQEGGQQGDAYLRNFLLSPDQITSFANLRDITPSIDAALKSWAADQKTKDDARVQAIKDPATRKTASSSATLLWSPDETMFITGDEKIVQEDGQKTTTPSVTSKPLRGFKVYDLTDGKSYDLPEAMLYEWLPDSRHIVLVDKDKISICEFDGGNVSVIYAGSFEDSLVFPWPDSSRLSFVTSFNTPTASRPNLFGINLK